MANFITHLKVSIFTSAALSSVVLNTHIATAPESILLFMIGALCGLLPDLDADNSNSIDWLFSILGITLSVGFILLIPQSSVVALWLMAGAVYLATHWLIKPLFEKLTVHRGSLHSIFAVVMFTLIGICSALLLSQPLNMALLIGVFIALGSLTHLILDEAYSVDLENNVIKASFGTAMKLIDLRFPLTSLFQAILIVCSLFYIFPHFPEIIKQVLIWQEKILLISFIPQSLIGN